MTATQGQTSAEPCIDSARESSGETGLRQLADRLENIIESNPAIIYMLTLRNGQFEVSFVSPDVEQRLGYPVPGVLGSDQWWRKNVHPHDLSLAARQMERWIASDTPAVLKRQYRFRGHDGQYRWIADWLQSACPDNDGNLQFVGSLNDITDSVTLAERLSQLSSVMPGMIYQYEETADGKRHFPYASEGAMELLGLSPAELLDSALPLLELVHEEDQAAFQAGIIESARSLEEWRSEFRVIRDGEVHWIFGRAKPERTDSGGTRWHGFMTDITERKALETELEHSRDILQKAQKIGRLGHWQSDLDTGELIWSDIIYDIFGVDPDTFMPTMDRFYEMVHPDDRKAVQESGKRAKRTGIHDVVHRIIRPDGSVRWVHELADMQRSGRHRNIMLGTVRDITEQKELEIRLRQQSTSDELTGAWNRRYFIEQISREFDRFKRHQHQGSLILFDFDHFKHVNDQYGHAAGDQVLAQSTATLQKRLRSTDCLARIGGEEFAVLLPSTTLEQALIVAEELRRSVEELVFHADEHSLKVTITCGVASFSDADEAFENTMHRADEAMYRGKNSGRNRISHA